jgi:RsiW-degrading membrane proteinase PrsW (M82 family)
MVEVPPRLALRIALWSSPAELLKRHSMSLPKPPKLHITPNGPVESVPSVENTAELQALRQELLVPVDGLRSLRWARDFRFLGVLGLALFPLAALAILGGAPQAVYWCLAVYFSAVWAMFFYGFFRPAGATRTDSLIAFFGTGIVSAVILVTASAVGFDQFRNGFLGSSSIFIQIAANILAVGLPAEACKALVFLYFLRRGSASSSVPIIVFYGLMAGFGFEIYEGTTYQVSSIPPTADTSSGAVPAVGASGYFHDVLRFTALPFLNAAWTAIGAYFWSLGALFASRRYALWAVALGVPTLLHGLHGSFVLTNDWITLLVDFVSAFALMMLLWRSLDSRKEPGTDSVLPPGLPATPT